MPATPPQGSTMASAVLVAAGATTTQTKTITNPSGRTLIVVLSATTALALNTVQVTVNGVTVSGYIYPIVTGIAVAAVGNVVYRVGPDLVPVANLTVNDVLPASIQVVATVVGAPVYGIDFLLGP
jgi:hypothetical protein